MGGLTEKTKSEKTKLQTGIGPQAPVLLDITGLDKAALLQTLHAAARLPLLDPPESALPISLAEADWYVENLRETRQILYWARIGGRVLKVNLTGNSLDPTKYDEANGKGAAKAAIDHLRKEAALEEDRKGKKLNTITGTWYEPVEGRQCQI